MFYHSLVCFSATYWHKTNLICFLSIWVNDVFNLQRRLYRHSWRTKSRSPAIQIRYICSSKLHTRTCTHVFIHIFLNKQNINWKIVIISLQAECILNWTRFASVPIELNTNTIAVNHGGTAHNWCKSLISIKVISLQTSNLSQSYIYLRSAPLSLI